MVHLLDLPDELLIKILKGTCPNGIEDLALSCKTLYNKSSEIITEHNANKKKYAVLNWPPRCVCRVNQNPACLSDLLSEPHLAPYVRRLDCYIWSNRNLQRHPEIFPGLPITTQSPIWQDFFDVDKCPYIPESAMGLWRDRRDRCDIEMVSALLLTKLPELRSLTMLSDFKNTPWMLKILIFSTILLPYRHYAPSVLALRNSLTSGNPTRQCPTSHVLRSMMVDLGESTLNGVSATSKACRNSISKTMVQEASRMYHR